MKILKLLLLIIALVFVDTISSAKEISQNQAEKVAKNFYYEVTASKGNNPQQISIKETFTIKKDGSTTYYAFNFTQGGFVIVSADDVYTPIIGYNTEFSYETKNMPASLQSFFDSYSDQIIYARENNLQSNYTEQWNRLLSNEIAVLNTMSRDAVEPLGAPIWNQDYPYNYYCPVGEGGRTYAGCVATAMQMVMYYWRWPFVGEGENGYNYGEYGYLYANFADSYYDWDGMVYHPSGFYPELSLMMYHVGISVNMMYGPDGSGAYSQDVPDAMIDHFKFKNTASQINRYDYQGNWTDLLKNELNNQRMMYYSGCSNSGCHAFVCEGYTSDDYFYFNFGWSGSSNGYYTLDVVGGFNQWQGVVIGLEPDENKGYPYYCSGTKIVTFHKGSIADGSGPLADYLPNTSASWLIDPVAGGTPIENITVSWHQLELATGSTLMFYDGENENAPLLAEFTATSSTYGFTTTGEKLFVTFTSSDQTDGGFNFEYISKIAKTCNNLTVINDATGTLTDGSEPNEYYAPNSQCMFQIFPNNGEPLKLTFNRIQLYEDDYDKISIYNIYTNSDYRIITTIKGTYDANDVLPEIYVETGNALIIFNTNSEQNSFGWEVEWRSAANINELTVFDPELSIYPNPTSDQLNISFNIENRDNVSVQLYSITGQLIYNEYIENFYGNYSNTININTWSSGIYLLRLTTSNNGTITKKAIIN